MAANARHCGPPPSLPVGRAPPKRPMSAGIRRSLDGEAAAFAAPSQRRGSSGGASPAAVSDGQPESFKTLDISLMNDSRHQHEKIDTFHTPGRNSRPSSEVPSSAAAVQSDVPSVDRGFLYTLQESILSSLRLEIREEASRLRQFFKKAVKEAKDELLMDMSTLQQSPAAVASKILGAVWEVLEEIKDSKDKLNISEVLQTIREHRNEVDLTEVLSSMDDIKRRLDLARLTSQSESYPSGLPEASAAGRSIRAEVDLSEVLAAVKENRVEVDLSGVLAAIKESKTEVDLSEVLSAIRENRVEVDFSEVLAAIKEGRAEAGLLGVSADRHSVLLSEVCEEVRRVRSTVDPAPVMQALEELRREAGSAAAAATAAGAAAAAAAVAAERPAAATVPEAVAGLPTALGALREDQDEILKAIRSLSSEKPPSIDLSEVLGTISEDKERLLEAVSSLREALTVDPGVGPALEALREEAADLAASRARLAGALAAQEERRAEGEQDIRQGLEAVRDLRKTVVLDLQPVLAGLDHTEVKMARVCEQLMTKLEVQHLEVISLMQNLCGAGFGAKRKAVPPAPDFRPWPAGRKV